MFPLRRRFQCLYLDTLKTLKFKISKVTCREPDFYLRELSGKARLDFEGEKDLLLRVLKKMMHASLCETGENLTEKPEDFAAFMESVPNKALLPLVNAFSALYISGETHLKKLIQGSFVFRLAVRLSRELHRPISEVLEYPVTEFNCWRRRIRRNTTGGRGTSA
ncbi:hypothetical protein [Succinimonas sp.]|uniref:hypothetical protein n=1 Tax=Succinimonas sp. TaxID=1936151 RepID=UPI00386950C2